MKLKKIIFWVLVIFLGLFGFYIYKLHSLALEGNKIFEQRCLVVNPSLIAYKNYFLSSVNAAKNPDKFTSDQVAAFYVSYLDGIRDYVPKEDDWIKTQSKFVNRWDFKLFEPWYVKDAGSYQVQMYEGYRDEAQALVDVLDGKITSTELEKRFTEARDKRNKYTDLYNGVFDKAVPIMDWRKIFGSVPVPTGCNDSNLIIPSTSGSLDDPSVPVKEPDITG